MTLEQLIAGHDARNAKVGDLEKELEKAQADLEAWDEVIEDAGYGPEVSAHILG